MKKFIPLIIIFSIIILTTVCSLLIIPKFFKEKKALKTEDFLNIAETKGFVLQDASENTSNYDDVKNFCVVAPEDLSYKIEFYEFNSFKAAKEAFQDKKLSLKNAERQSLFKNSIEVGLINMLEITTKSEYIYLYKIDNTYLFVRADKKYKENICEFLKYIGY